MPNEFKERCREIAKHFLLTAVVVDDQPYFESPVSGGLTPPGRGDHVATEGAHDEGTPNSHSLSATAVTASFVDQGLICGVIQPGKENDSPNLPVAVKRADVVVVDWRLNGDNGDRALELLRWILRDDANERLRLIAVYTGEPDIRGIGTRIVSELESGGISFESAADQEQDLVYSMRSSLIVIYAKHGTTLEPGLRTKAVREHDLATRLIDDFTGMVEGLLPSIALIGLTAVRENAHKVLSQFETKLDPAYLTHRACLPSPDDSEQHIVVQLASELHGIMDEAVAKESPAGLEAIERWLAKFKGGEQITFPSGKSMTNQQVMKLLTDGLDKAHGPLSKSRDHEIMTSGFARRHDGPPHGLDGRLAAMMCFRTVFDRTLKRLWMGTAVRKQDESGDYRYLLCMRPRCDSVRMTKAESFLFVPLACHVPKTFQIVIPVEPHAGSPPRLSVDTNMSEWVMIDFEPDGGNESVVAIRDGATSYFLSTDDTRYEWIGELKVELAQSLAQSLASSLSGVALDRSEWLRRSERLG